MAIPKKKTSAKPKDAPTARRAAVRKEQSTAPVIPGPVAAPVTQAPSRTITHAERQRMIEESAYYRAEKASFTGSPDEHWSAAEHEIDARLLRERVRVV